VADEDLQAFIVRTAADMAGDQGSVAMLEGFLASGQCMLLLDGLDQAATDEQRRMLIESVSHAAAVWRSRGNRVIVSSRMAGYGAAPLAETFSANLIRPLDRSQIGPYLLRWSLAAVRLRRPLMRDDEALQQAQSETLALVREVTMNPQLAALAATPLMLRLLVGTYRPGALIGPGKVAVYQMVADALIHDWRLPQSAANPPVILEQEATTLLGHLAYWIHASRPSGRLSAGELRAILTHIWRQHHPDLPVEQGQEAVDEFVGRLGPQSGVLVELDTGEYGFIFHGLQEYFAARYLVSSFRLAAGRIRAYLHDPRWDEVIRLAIGFTALGSQEDASDLIETGILARGPRAAELDHQPSPFEDFLRRDLFFAARLLAAGAEARPEVTQVITRELVALWLNGDRDSAGRFSLIFDAARRHLAQLDGTEAGRRAMQIVLDDISSADEHRRAYAGDAVSLWPAYAGDAVERLVRAGRDAPPLVRRAIAQALGRLGDLPAEAYKLLLSLVNDTDEAVAGAARATLLAAQPVPQEALGMFIDLLRSGTAAGRRVSLRQLQQVGALPPGVVAELIHLLSDPEPDIRQAAMDALAGTTHLPENALMTICRVAMDAASSLRHSALAALRRPVELPREVIDHLVEWTGDEEVTVRRAAALALGTCLNKTPEVMQALIECLADPVDSIRADVVEPLAHKGRDEARVMHVLAHAVSDSTHRVRCAVAAAIRHFPEPNADLRGALKLLLGDKEVIVREAALDTIAGLKEPGGDLIEEVVALVKVQDFGIGARAVRALAGLRGLPQSALLALVGALPTHWEVEGEAMAACLRAHFPLGLDLVYQIMDLAVLRSVGMTQAARLPGGLRVLALDILGHGLDEAPDIVSVLLEAANDGSSPEVQIAALRGLAHSRTLWPEVRQVMFRLVREGPLPVRCSAGVALGRLMHSLPDPPLSAADMGELAGMLAALLKEITPRASWEIDTQTQNDLLRALSQVVARSRPSPPRLTAHVEDVGS
jgi:HEAT repeat protein